VARLQTAPLTPSSYVPGRLLRTKERYITAKAASSTPPTIKIKVVTIALFSSAGPYNLRPRSYRHERRVVVRAAAVAALQPRRRQARPGPALVVRVKVAPPCRSEWRRRRGDQAPRQLLAAPEHVLEPVLGHQLPEG
jgi:hypothetical protein